MATRIPDPNVKPKLSEVLPRLHQHLDLIGFVLFAPAVIMILMALQWGGVVYAWKSATIIGLFVGGAGNFAVWAIWNWYKGDDAMLPIRLMKRRIVWSSALNQMWLFTTLFIAAFFMPIYFQAVKGSSPFMAGVYVLPSIVSQLIAAVASGVLGKFTIRLPN